MAVYKADILDIELNTGNIARSFLCHNIGKDDQKADRFGVRCFRDGEPVSLSGVSIQGFMLRPNGSHFHIHGSANTGVSGNEAWVDLPQEAYDYEGQFCLALKLIGGEVTGTIRIIDGMVNNTFVDGAVAPTAAVPTYQEILSVYDQMVAAKAGSVRFDTDQTLTAAQMTQARGNIEAASESDVADLKSALTIASGNLASDAITITNLYINTSGVLTAQAGSGSDRTICINAEPNHLYTIQKDTVTTMRVGAGSANNLPAGSALVQYSGHTSASNAPLYVQTDEINHYIYIQLFASSDNTDLQSIAANTSTLCVFVSTKTVEQTTKDINETLGMLISDESVYFPFVTGDNLYGTAARVFWSEIIPEKCTLKSVKIYVKNVGTNPSITVDVWDLEDGVLTKKETIVKTAIAANNVNTISVSRFSDKPQMVSYTFANCQAVFYRVNQTGHSWYYTTNVSADALNKSDLSTYNNMILVGGYIYQKKFNEQDTINTDFFSWYLMGNIVVFGDSTVDGSSTTGHTGNVIGTDRTSTAEPNAFTSILEGMIQTFTGKSIRVYNGGFGGKTLNYIADNYAGIMAAFSNVKSALLVIDVNSANGTRAEYENGIRTGLERMIALLQDDGIAVAISSPQPMFFYPADNGGLPAINSAGEFAIAVNIGKDICTKYNLPFINHGEITNKVMTSPYFTSDTFYGDRIHFGDGGHKFEGYELYGELIHPIIFYNGGNKLIRLESNQCELPAASDIQANTVRGYRSIVLSADHTRDDVISRFYIISLIPFKLGGVDISGWAYNADMYVDGVLYTEGTSAKGAVIQPGTHEVTIKPEAGKIVRFSGLTIESGE